jgi:hypothetical protein
MIFLFEIRTVNGIWFNAPSWIKNAKSIYHSGIFKKEHNYTQNMLIFANAPQGQPAATIRKQCHIVNVRLRQAQHSQSHHIQA